MIFRKTKAGGRGQSLLTELKGEYRKLTTNDVESSEYYMAFGGENQPREIS